MQGLTAEEQYNMSLLLLPVDKGTWKYGGGLSPWCGGSSRNELTTGWDWWSDETPFYIIIQPQYVIYYTKSPKLSITLKSS